MQRNFYLIGLALCFVLTGIQPVWATPSVSANATAAASNLTLDGEGSDSTHIVKIANLTLSTDNSTGYTVTITSGSISHAGLTPINFQVITVPKDNPAPNSGDFTVTSGQSYTFSTTQASTNEQRDLYIKYTPQALQDPGLYSQTISLTISDNP